MAVKFLLGLILIFFLVTFAANNNQMVTVSYYFGYSYDLNLWVATLTSFGIGSLLTCLIWMVAHLRVSYQNRLLTRQVATLEKDLAALKQAPLPDEPSVYPPDNSGGSFDSADHQGNNKKSLPVSGPMSASRRLLKGA